MKKRNWGGAHLKPIKPINDEPDKFGMTETERLQIIAENNRRGVGHLLYDGNLPPREGTPAGTKKTIRAKRKTTTHHKRYGLSDQP